MAACGLSVLLVVLLYLQAPPESGAKPDVDPSLARRGRMTVPNRESLPARAAPLTCWAASRRRDTEKRIDSLSTVSAIDGLRAASKPLTTVDAGEASKILASSYGRSFLAMFEVGEHRVTLHTERDRGRRRRLEWADRRRSYEAYDSYDPLPTGHV
jgi:hypothetical protein